jgi:hypothetical protein
MLISFGAVAAVTAGVLAVAHAHNHNTASASDETGSSNTSVAQLTPEATILHFPAADVAKLRSITHDTLTKLEAGDQPGATAQVKDLETTWDKDQPTLQPRDATAWHFLDGEIDDVLTALRAKKPNPATEQNSLQTLLRSLGG